jgi:UDP-N-acetyl-2-amino-2-deoxyglucuronate dehydrogenase
VSSTRRQVGVALVGCGTIGAVHARALSQIAGAELVAVVDTVPEKAGRLAAEFGGEPADLDGALMRSDVAVVSICTPSGLHGPLGVRAAAAGKHVLVEKPVEISLESADALIAACRGAGVSLGVISQHRFDPGVVALRSMLEAGQLGRLLHADAIVKWYRSQAYYDSATWRGTWNLDGGGCLMNQGVHYVDLLQWMMGPVDRVFARCATAAHEIEVEDIALALLTFQNGAVGSLVVSTAAYPGFPERLEISGTNGTAVVVAGQLAVCELKQGSREDAPYGRQAVDLGVIARSTADDPAAVAEAAHAAQIEDFVRGVADGRPPAVTGDEARKSLEIILAIYESSRIGTEVRLPLTPAGATPPGPGSALPGDPDRR